MYKLLSLIHNRALFISIGLCFAFFNVGSITLVALGREYALQEALFILSTYLLLKFYKKLEIKTRVSVKEIFVFALGFSLFLFSVKWIYE